jgi:hypothetical protein
MVTANLAVATNTAKASDVCSDLYQAGSPNVWANFDRLKPRAPRQRK